MAFGGGTSDGSDYLFAVGPDVALRWLGILGPAYLEDDWSQWLERHRGGLLRRHARALSGYAPAWRCMRRANWNGTSARDAAGEQALAGIVQPASTTMQISVCW